jgi:hypothetical protein
MHFGGISPPSQHPCEHTTRPNPPFPSPTRPTLRTYHTGYNIRFRSFSHLTITSAAPERGTQRSVLVREIKDMLGKAGALDDAANLDGTLFLDELADRVEERWGELRQVSVRVWVYSCS